jgi:hypothetical protein
MNCRVFLYNAATTTLAAISTRVLPVTAWAPDENWGPAVLGCALQGAADGQCCKSVDGGATDL